MKNDNFRETTIQKIVVNHFRQNQYIVIQQCIDNPVLFSDIRQCKTHEIFGIDVVAQKGKELWIIEVKGQTNGGIPASSSNFMTGIGQILSRITQIDDKINYGLAIPNNDSFSSSIKKFMHSPVFANLNLSLLLIQENKQVDFFN